MHHFRELQSEKYLGDHYRAIEQQQVQEAAAQRARSTLHSAVAIFLFSSVVCAALTANHWFPGLRQWTNGLNFTMWFL